MITKELSENRAVKQRFGEIIGQEKLKKQLNFYVDSYNATGYWPPCIFSAARGLGKSFAMELVARRLRERNSNKIKKYVKVNASSIGNRRDFLDDVVFPHLVNSDCSLALDEIHKLHPGAINLLLDILAPSPNHINQINIDGNNITFDLRRISFLSGTTNTETLPPAFLDRLVAIEFEEYRSQDLAEILVKNLKGATIQPGLDHEIAQVARNNPRSIVKLAFDIRGYLSSENKSHLAKRDWLIIKDSLSICPLGLSKIEIQILRILENMHSGCSLTKLASILALDTKTVRTYFELHLLRNGLIDIRAGSGRVLSQKGRDYLELIKS